MTMADITAQLDSIDRDVRSTEVDGRAAKALVVRQTYASPVDELWDAITTADRIARWLGPISGDLRLGGTYQIEGNAHGTVLECVPPQRLRVTWEYGEEVGWVQATLAKDGPASTSLTVEHLAPLDAERWAEYGPGALGIGWDMMLLGLSLHLAGGGLESPEEAAAWVVSEEGRAFMTASGEHWYAAQVAGGDDEDAARGAADRTIAAYTAVPE
jgi:uncharacterized protein YndB with AHSA1/START domain